uniref:Tudor domain-containing protein n=1 Tax=Anopheles atroparvus TaxID=41427 RepID=A0AAG5CS70_ANOAO
MEVDTIEMYERLFNVSYDCLKQNCIIASALTSMMQKRADLLRSQLLFPVTGGRNNFISEFRKSYDELHSMATSVQRFVGEWQALLMDEQASVCKENASIVVDFKFDYIKQPLVYENGQVVKLIVTDISKTGQDVFCAVDQRQSSKLSNFLVKLQKLQSLKSLKQLPPAGQVFAIRLENIWFRAVRNRPGCNGGDDKIAIYLLDSGEVLLYNATCCIAELPEEFRTIPSYVIKCRLVSDGSAALVKQFEEISCKVVQVEDDAALRLEQLPEGQLNGKQVEETQLNGEQAEDTQLNGEQAEDTQLNETPVGTPNEEAHISPNRSEIQAPQSDEQRLPVDKKPTNAEQLNGESCRSDKNYAISRETLSEEQLRQFDELPESTSNAMKAIFGYVPKDDEQICKFYDPKTKGCFKGGNCRLRHIEKDPDGWTRDRDTVVVCSMLQNLEVPAANTFVTLIPTMVIDMDLFYAHLVPPDGLNKDFNQLSADLNNPEIVAHYKELKLLPAVGELVLAKYENAWYRAQVCELSDQFLSVFYVDYGNQESLPINDVRMCPDRFKYMPQQAICCRVANATTAKAFHAEAIEQFSAALIDKQLKALVIDNKIPWELQIFDEEGFDIGHGMIITKLAKPRTPSKIDDLAKIPG